MTNPKRYRMEGRLVNCAPDDSERYYAEVEEIEALNGEWVKWEDVKPLLRAHEPPTARHPGDDPGIPLYATLRTGSLGNWLHETHLECRFKNGDKFAAVVIDYECNELAEFIRKAIEKHNSPTDEPTVQCTCSMEIKVVSIDPACPQGHGKGLPPRPLTTSIEPTEEVVSLDLSTPEGRNRAFQRYGGQVIYLKCAHEPSGTPDAAFLSAVGHCSNCRCDDCMSFFHANALTALGRTSRYFHLDWLCSCGHATKEEHERAQNRGAEHG